MTQTIEFEGVQHEFPDDFTSQDIQKALASAHPMQPQAQQQPAQPLAPGPFTQRAPDGRLITRPPTPQEVRPEDLGADVSAGLSGSIKGFLPFNLGPKALARVTSLFDNRGYDANLADINSQLDSAIQKNRGAGAVGTGVGIAMSPFTRGTQAIADAALPTTGTGLTGAFARYGNRMGVGAVTGGGYGAGFAEPGKEKEGFIKGAISGGLTAGALQAGADAIGAGSKLINATRGAVGDSQSAAEAEQALYDQKNALYQQAHDSGVIVKPDAFKKFVDELPGKLSNYRERLAPETSSLLAEFQADAKGGAPKTLADLDELRQLGRELIGPTAKPNDVRLISDIRDHLDEFMDGLQGHQLMAPEAESGNAVDTLKQARAAARDYYRLRDVNDIVEKGADLNNPGYVKNQFASIIRRGKLGQYTADEQEAIKDIARNGDVRKWLKLVPWRGLQMSATYADPFMQNAKINTLQNTIVRGGLQKPTAPAAIFGGRVAPYAGPAAGWLLSGSPRPSTAQ